MPDVPKEISDVRARYEWRKIEAPKTWRPKMNGEEIAGFYGGKTMRNGRFGQYEVVLIHVPKRGLFMISGTRIVQLIDAAAVVIGWPVRVIWRGSVALDDDKTMKTFDVFVAETDPIAADELPAVKQQTGMETDT